MKLSLIIFWRKFSVVLFSYLIKEDGQNVLLLLARKPWGTGMILWSRAAVSTLGRSHWSWSKSHRPLLSRCSAGTTSSACCYLNVCWMCGRNEVRINEDQVWTTKRRSRNEHHKRLAEICNRSQQSLQIFASFYIYWIKCYRTSESYCCLNSLNIWKVLVWYDQA